MQPCNRNILEALKLVCSMNLLADKGEEDSEDDSCAVLYGIIRDCAYRIRLRAEAERRAHLLAGRWDDEDVQETQGHCGGCCGKPEQDAQPVHDKNRHGKENVA